MQNVRTKDLVCKGTCPECESELKVLNEYSVENFQPKGKRIALLRMFSITSKEGFLSRWYSNKLERRVRAGESELRHVGYCNSI